MTAWVGTILHQKDNLWKVKVGAGPKLIQLIFIHDHEPSCVMEWKSYLSPTEFYFYLLQ